MLRRSRRLTERQVVEPLRPHMLALSPVTACHRLDEMVVSDWLTVRIGAGIMAPLPPERT